jgi:serine/threonine-protein kinase
MDFGVAKISESASAVATRPGTLVGTPLYMSPEQWESGPTDARTDVYSLGLVLYEMLTGLLPHQGTLTQVVKSLTLDEARPPSAHRKDLTPALSKVVARAIRKNPAERQATMEELASDLRGVRESRSTPTLMPPPRRSLWRDRRVLAAGLAFVAVAGIASAVSHKPARDTDAARPSAAPPPVAVVLTSPPLPSASTEAAPTAPPSTPAVMTASLSSAPNRTMTTPRSLVPPVPSAAPSASTVTSASAAPSSSAPRPPKNLLFGE